MIQAKGYVIALLEIAMFAILSSMAQMYITPLQKMSGVMYYWFCFSVLTGFWEAVYVSCYDQVASLATQLVKTKKSVWTESYPLYYVLPNLLARFSMLNTVLQQTGSI